MKHKHVAAETPDPGLDQLLSDLRIRVRRRSHGRVFAEINIHGHQVTGVAFSECLETWEDVQREMTGYPHKVEFKTGRR